ncbi:tRNA wybutosine-synthesizing protein [Fonsecaea pedrosoi]|nr:tRNA wybutosine-synthesizing protein [Fonsecaea pedrosoi]
MTSPQPQHQHQHHQSQQVGKPKQRKDSKTPNNPLVRGISAFYTEWQGRRRRIDPATATDDNATFVPAPRHGEGDDPPLAALAIADMPKRYTLYPPLLLLPPNFTAQNPRWTAFYDALDEHDKAELFRCITEKGFKGMGISWIAINAPIAAEVEHEEDVEDATNFRGPATTQGATTKEQNVLRHPSGLVPVYGDWGPLLDERQHRGRILHPSAEDFEAAFWTSATQHHGIVQCWAPLYTMFSRGNISEKARILGLHSRFPGLTTAELHGQLGLVDVVDFYVGIGYFASCYLSKGVRRVYGWDINPWSIEGLRRGCERNGWRCLVLQVDETGSLQEPGGIKGIVEEIARGDRAGDTDTIVRCVAFLGDNKWARKILQEMQCEYERMGYNRGETASRLNIRHANLGLLPSARSSWEDAVEIVTGLSEGGIGGWLHVHENVDMREIDIIGERIVREIDGLVQREARRPCATSGVHVEQVKTYAPGVMHCVFDVEIKPHG